MKFFLSSKRNNRILELLRLLRIRPDKRLMYYGAIQRVYWTLKYPREKREFMINNQSFAPSSSIYGHEFWLKKYSGFTGDVYAHIEHGVYFGDDRSIISNPEEWTLGNFITFGESRTKLLNEMYPGFNVFPIGPRLHYVDVDKEYYDELKSQLKPNVKTIVLYPGHSLLNAEYKYNSNLFLEHALDYAKRVGADNVLVSLHPADFAHGKQLSFQNKKLITVTGGPANSHFLPRLKAILSLADVTYSNALGTHVGYSLYMGKPHMMNLASNLSLKSWNNKVEVKENLLFAECFPESDSLEITDKQYSLCDYYFGLSKVKSPDELYNIFIECKRKYETMFK